MKVTKWKIWYDDGSTFSSEDGKAEAAPSEGVQIVAEIRGKRKILHHGGEYYRWDRKKGQWRGVPDIPDIKKSGLQMKDKDFEKITKEALKWLQLSK